MRRLGGLQCSSVISELSPPNPVSPSVQKGSGRWGCSRSIGGGTPVLRMSPGLCLKVCGAHRLAGNRGGRGRPVPAPPRLVTVRPSPGGIGAGGRTGGCV